MTTWQIHWLNIFFVMRKTLLLHRPKMNFNISTINLMFSKCLDIGLHCVLIHSRMVVKETKNSYFCCCKVNLHPGVFSEARTACIPFPSTISWTFHYRGVWWLQKRTLMTSFITFFVIPLISFCGDALCFAKKKGVVIKNYDNVT